MAQKIMMPEQQAERTTFMGVILSKEIKALPKLLKKVDKPLFSALLTLTLQYIEDAPIDENALSSLVKEGIDSEFLSQVYGGLLQLITGAVRHPSSSIKKLVMQEDLAFLGIPQDFIPDIIKVAYGSKRGEIDGKLTSSRLRLPTIQEFKWRVDVAISTSGLKRALKPSILMQLQMTDGSLNTFECGADQFHQLRYNVAFVLKEMEDLQKRQVFHTPL